MLLDKNSLLEDHGAAGVRVCWWGENDVKRFRDFTSSLDYGWFLISLHCIVNTVANG